MTLALLHRQFSSEGAVGLSGAHTLGVGTASYASPEQLTGGVYGNATDIHALGVVVAELLCPVRTNMERAALLQGVRDGFLPPDVTSAFPETTTIVLSMTHKLAEMRPTAVQLISQTPTIIKEVQQFFSLTGKEVVLPNPSFTGNNDLGARHLGAIQSTGAATSGGRSETIFRNRVRVRRQCAPRCESGKCFAKLRKRRGGSTFPASPVGSL